MEAGDVGPVPDRIPTTAVPFTADPPTGNSEINQTLVIPTVQSSAMAALSSSLPQIKPAAYPGSEVKDYEASDVDFQLPGIFWYVILRHHITAKP